MRFGLCTISAGETSVKSVLDTAANVGVEGVEIWGKEPHVGDGSRSVCRDISERAENRGLDIPVYGSYLRPGTDSFDEAFREELDVANWLGADMIRVWAGRRAYEDADEQYWRGVVDDLSRLADAAADRGIGVTVERHEGTVTDTSEGAAALIREVDHDNCQLNWQPPFSLPAEDVLADAERLAPISNNMHVQAVPQLDTEERCLLEDAYFDLEAILLAFDSQGFDGFVEIEFVTDRFEYEQALRRDLNYLQSIVP